MQPSMLKGRFGTPVKSCMLYRGCMPVMVNATSGSIEGDVLDAMLDYVSHGKGLGLPLIGSLAFLAYGLDGQSC